MDKYERIRQPLDAKPPHIKKFCGSEYTLSGKTTTFGHIDHYPSDEIVGVTEEMYKAAWPIVEGIEGELVIITGTPKGDNHYYDLWNKVNEDDANIPDYLKEWINLINLQRQQEQNIKPLPITVGILSWASHSTLRNTLQSYKDNGLFEAVQEVIIFFQEVSETDLAIAEEFGITNIISSETNIGIGPAIVSLVEQARCPYVLFLEMDWVLIESAHTVKTILNGAVNLIEQGDVDFYRLRHGFHYGEPLYTKQFRGRELDSPEHLIEQVHFLGRSLADKFPDLIKYTDQFNTGTVYGDSRYCNYSNNPFICKKEFYLKHVAPADKGGISLEGEIRKVWQEAGHKVGYNTIGLFKHERLDR